MSAILVNYCLPKNEQKFKKPTNPQKEFLTLNEYIQFSRYAIARFANSYVPNLAYSMLKSDDAISFVCEFIMFNDWTFGNGNGQYSILASRLRASKWSILKYIKLSQSQQYTIPLSLLTKKTGKNAEEFSEYCTAAKKEFANKTKKIAEEKFVEELTHLENKELDRKFHNGFERLIHDARLSNRQEECIRLKFEDGFTEQRIAESLGISRQAVNNYIFNALYKIKVIAP